MAEIVFSLHGAPKWSPSSADEAAAFEQTFCARCEHDRFYRQEEGDSCPIAASGFNPHKDFPTPDEWVLHPDDGKPACGCFLLADGETPPRCRSTPDLFGESNG